MYVGTIIGTNTIFNGELVFIPNIDISYLTEKTEFIL